MPLHFNTTPLVSVVMCTFNGEAYLSQQLESIIHQTYLNLEIVIADDGSTDKTIQIITGFQLKDTRIKFFRNDKNLGYNKNFENGFFLCQGEYIAISDQDDIWELNKIEYMMKCWPGGSSFIYSLSGHFTGNDFEGRTAAPKVLYTDITDVHKLVFNSPVHGHACMFKKELMALCTPLPDDIFYDWWISMHAAAAGTIGCIPKTLTWHRVHESNSSRNIISLKDKDERNRQLREQCIYFIETFCSRCKLNLEQEQSLLMYASLLREVDGKKFSWPLFRYVFKNRKIVFHYKKHNPLIIFSYLKHALKMAYKGLL